MQYLKTFLFISIYILMTGNNVYSQRDSLFRYIETALENNPGMQQKFIEYKAALQKVPQAAGLPDPQLNISYFLMPMELVNGKQIAEMSLMQMFPWFGVLKNAREEMRNMALMEFEEYRDQGLQIVYNVESTWYDLYRVRKTMDITRRNIEILKSIEDIALIRYSTSPAGTSVASPVPAGTQTPSGSAPGGGSMQGMQGMPGRQQVSTGNLPAQSSMPMNDQMEPSSGTGLADLYRLTMETADLENTVNSLKDQEQTLTARFNILLNRPEDQYVFVPDTLVADTPDIFAGADTGLYKRNPMLGMVDYEKKAYEARGKMSEKMGLPMVGLGIGYSLIGAGGMSGSEMDGSDMIMPMVSITLPVWRKKYRAMKREAEILVESTDQRYQSVYNDVRTEHNEALRMYRDANRRLQLYDRQSELASYTFDLLRTRLSVSSAGLTDILRVQQQLLEYEMKEIEAVADLNKAAAMLKRIRATSINDSNLKKQ